ncbi:MAG: energy-coupling factor ABC transporter permease [Victivallaceae bacterium]|nr:energy-coupling factor ABC transporter permease [Victivallaceae bacterium]
MHIPEQMLTGTTCPVTALLGAAVISGACIVVSRKKSEHSMFEFAAVSSLIFAGQMLNFPILNGVSGHLLGGVLAAALLGTPLGILAIALVVTVQSILFADGGMSVLGANLLNMAVIGAGVGGLALYQFKKYFNQYLAIVLAGFLSVTLAALAVSIELAFAGTVPLADSLPSILGVHLLIGVAEGVFSVAIYALVINSSQLAKLEQRTGIKVAALTVVALLVTPLASQHPDGLEYIAQNLNFLPETAIVPLFSLMPDYCIPMFGQGAFSTLLAGLIGAIIVAFAALTTAKFLRVVKR